MINDEVEKSFLSSLGLLSIKPKIIVCNVGEESLGSGNKYTENIKLKYSSEKIIEQFKKAKEAGAEALLVYNDPTFVNDITINADGTKNFQGIFYNKRPRLTMTRFDQALWWTPHHGTLEGFYQELTTKDTFTAGTKIHLNVKKT